MSLIDLSTFIVILISMSLAPGPLVAVVMARSMNHDTIGALALTVGIAFGNVAIIAMIYAGLGVWLGSAPEVFQIAKFAGMGYLFWLAFDMWRQSDADAEKKPMQQKGICSSAAFGFCSCFISPHYILLYILFLPQILDLSKVSYAMLGVFSGVSFAALVATYGSVIVIAAMLRARTAKGSRTTVINRVLATVIAVSGVWMVTA